MSDERPATADLLGPGGHWRNWVGNQSFVARHKAEPASEDELAALVVEAARRDLGVRVAGSGHSFTPVVATGGLLLSLKAMQGVVGADLERKRVTVAAGTRIGDIGRPLRHRLGDQAQRRETGEQAKPGQRQGGGEGAAGDDQGLLPDWRVHAEKEPQGYGSRVRFEGWWLA